MRSITEYGNGFFLQKPRLYSDNTHLALSGGRSSGALLRLLLDLYGGTLPQNIKVIFTNTGAEDEETLVFVQKMADQWKVDITWLELSSVLPGQKAVSFRQVDFATASRKGEPWHILREAKPNYPPRRAERLCTVFMKVYVAQAFLRSLGWLDWTTLFGYRADESGRLYRALVRCARQSPFERPEAPLILAGLNKAAVLHWWAQNDFDLAVDPLCGNCVFCFLKGEEKLKKIYQMRPTGIDFYVDIEKQWTAGIPRRDGKSFGILPNGGYQGIKDRTLAEMPPIEPEDNIEDLECKCTD